jgi:hypothetical protein
MNQNFYKTHKLFFTLTSYEKLNEFLKRADNSTKVLQNHINQELQNGLYCIIKINSEKNAINNQGNKTNKCTQIVFEYYNANNDRIGHTTFHLEPEKKYKNNNPIIIGRFHLKNDRDKQVRYPLKINRTKNNNEKYNNSITFSINKHKYINRDIKQCIDVTIAILNSYFNLDINNPDSIDNRLASNYSYISNTGQHINSYWHKCFGTIIKQFNTLPSSLKYLKPKTQKRRKYNTYSYSKTSKK